MSTTYIALRPWYARLIVVVLVAAIDWCVLHDPEFEPLTFSALVNTVDDTDLYSAVAGRVRAGYGYYAAAAIELRARGYPVRSVFNWRFPVYAWIFGRLPSPLWARGLLLLTAAAAIALASNGVGMPAGPGVRLAAAILLGASYIVVLIPGKEYNMEIWSGIVMIIAIMLYNRERWQMAMAAAVAAVLLRELALPFCAVASALAVWRRRGAEVRCWLTAYVALGLAFYLHFRSVADHTGRHAQLQAAQWVAFGGIPFLLDTCRANPVLAAAPAWWAAVFLPLSLLGLMGWPGRPAAIIKLTAAVYVLFFGVVGQVINYYWGWLLMPLLVLGVVRAPASLRDLVLAAFRRG